LLLIMAQTLNSPKLGRPAMRWMGLEEVAEALEWDAAALRRLLVATRGEAMPGAVQEEDGTWSVPESALRRLTGAGLFLFSFSRLAELLDCDATHLRRLAKAGKLKTVQIPNVGARVPWSEYQRLTGRSTK
jgi:hypothetical protein